MEFHFEFFQISRKTLVFGVNGFSKAACGITGFYIQKTSEKSMYTPQGGFGKAVLAPMWLLEKPLVLPFGSRKASSIIQ